MRDRLLEWSCECLNKKIDGINKSINLRALKTKRNELAFIIGNHAIIQEAGQDGIEVGHRNLISLEDNSTGGNIVCGDSASKIEHKWGYLAIERMICFNFVE